MKKKENVIEEISKQLLELMGVDASVSVESVEKEESIYVNIDTEKEVGLLIGTRGETLNAIQAFIGMAYKNKTDQWQRIVVNVADWREKQAEKLTSLALSAAGRAKETGEDQPLYNLSAAERRTVHMALVDDKDVKTESFGEGEDRYLIIKLAKNSS